jgi:hypothetical protein
MGRILFGISSYFINTFLISFFKFGGCFAKKKLNLIAQKWNTRLEIRYADKSQYTCKAWNTTLRECEQKFRGFSPPYFSYIFRQTLHRLFTEKHAAVNKPPTNDVFSLL